MKPSMETRGRRLRALHADERGIISGLIIRTVILLGLLGLVINDGGRLIGAQVKAQSVARAAAEAGADTYFRTKRADLAKQQAIVAAQQTDPAAVVTFFGVDRNGRVTVRAEKTADTLIVERVGLLKDFGVQSATEGAIRVV